MNLGRRVYYRWPSVMPIQRLSERDYERLADIRKPQAIPDRRSLYERMADLIVQYFESFSKPILNATLWTRFLNDCPFARSMVGSELQQCFDEWNEQRLYNLRKFFARNKVIHFDPNAYLPAEHAQTVVAQSFSRRPLRFGGNDRVLSDQHKFGSRSERASMKHHETDSKGNVVLHKYYGSAEKVYDKTKPQYTRKLVGNRIKPVFKGHYRPADEKEQTPVPRGDHYMER